MNTLSAAVICSVITVFREPVVPSLFQSVSVLFVKIVWFNLCRGAARLLYRDDRIIIYSCFFGSLNCVAEIDSKKMNDLKTSQTKIDSKKINDFLSKTFFNVFGLKKSHVNN